MSDYKSDYKNWVTISVPIPIQQDIDQGTVAPQGHFYPPKNITEWFEKFVKVACAGKCAYITVSNDTDCPQRFTIALSDSPGQATQSALQDGLNLGFEVNIDALEELYKAIGYVLNEERREQL